MYVELKTGYSDNGPEWIGKVKFSKTGQTIYFNGKTFKKTHGFVGNYYDAETDDEYWISGVKKNGEDRHWAGAGKVKIDKKIVDDYLNIIGQKSIDTNKFEIVHITDDFPITKTYEKENLHEIKKPD